MGKSGHSLQKGQNRYLEAQEFVFRGGTNVHVQGQLIFTHDGISFYYHLIFSIWGFSQSRLKPFDYWVRVNKNQ